MSEIVPASVRPRVEGNFKKGENGTHQHVCPWIKFQQIPVSPVYTLKLHRVSTTQVLCKLLPLCWVLERVHLGFLQPFGSPIYKPLWFSKPDFMRLFFLVQVSQVGTWTPCSLGENLQGCDIPPAHCESPYQVCVGGGGSRVGSDQMESLTLPTHPSQCDFLCILSCRKSVLLVFRWFSETAVLYEVVIWVSMRGGEFRIFLLHHL